MRKPLMASLFAAGVIGAAHLLSPAPAQAEIQYPWCSQGFGKDEDAGRNCGFVSYDQCMASARGIGALCVRNDMYRGPDRPSAQRPAKRPQR